MSKDKSETDTEQKGKDTASSRRKESEHLLFIGAKRALIGGLIAGGVVLGGQFLVGRIYSGTEARRLMEAVVPLRPHRRHRRGLRHACGNSLDALQCDAELDQGARPERHRACR
jgi:hypothetical protein